MVLIETNINCFCPLVIHYIRNGIGYVIITTYARRSKKTEGPFGSFLEMVSSEPSFPVPQDQCIPSEELEDGIVHLLALLKQESGGPILIEDLYRKCSLRLRLFGEVLKVMNQEKLVVFDAQDQVSLAPGILEQL